MLSALDYTNKPVEAVVVANRAKLNWYFLDHAHCLGPLKKPQKWTRSMIFYIYEGINTVNVKWAACNVPFMVFLTSCVTKSHILLEKKD